MRLLLVVSLLCMVLPANAAAGIPCEIINTWLEGDTPVVLVTPAGTAPSLAEQGVVIHVEVMDCTPAPIADFPFQDIWVDADAELNLCPGGSVADANTDENGRTTISGTIFAGDHSEHGVTVYVNGIPSDTGPLDLNFVSPDLNGDRFVNLNDFSIFGQDYDTSAMRSDLVPDGIVNLADFSRFGQHYFEQCP